MYNALSIENRILKKQLKDYYFQPNTLERRVKRLEKNVRSLKVELKDLDECIDKKTMVDLIQDIAFLHFA
ncbi:4745_t:CDS:2 [Funneliformis geosporum]|nr:4745_t:CDS:2 [Funneliformis geosporum]